MSAVLGGRNYLGFMTDDFELDKTLMCRSIGKAVSDFVAKQGVGRMSVGVVCDTPDVSYDESGRPHHGASVRVYIDIGEEDEDDE